MASKPEFQYVNVMQNGVLKKIIVPVPANSNQSSNGLVPSVPQTSSSTTMGHVYSPNLSHVGNVRSPSPSLVQARQKLSGVLAKHKNHVYLTSTQGIGSLSHQAVNRSYLTTSTASLGQTVQTAQLGQVPVMLMPPKQPTLGMQGQTSLVRVGETKVLLANTQLPQVVRTAQGTQLLLLPAAFQGQPQASSLAQITNTSASLSNGLVTGNANRTNNVLQSGPSLLNVSQLTTQSSLHGAKGQVTVTNPVPTLPTTGTNPLENEKSTSGLQIGSVFSLKDVENDAVLSKVITIEPEDSDVTVNVEDDDCVDNSTQQMFASGAFQEQADYKVLAEWDQEPQDDEWISHPEPSPVVHPKQELHVQTDLLANLAGGQHAESSASQIKTTTVSTDHMVSTLKTALKSPESRSLLLPDGRIVLISPSGGTTEQASNVLNTVLQTENHQSAKPARNISLRTSPPRTVNVVRVSRVRNGAGEKFDTSKVLPSSKPVSSSGSTKEVHTSSSPSVVKDVSSGTRKISSEVNNGATLSQLEMNSKMKVVWSTKSEGRSESGKRVQTSTQPAKPGQVSISEKGVKSNQGQSVETNTSDNELSQHSAPPSPSSSAESRDKSGAVDTDSNCNETDNQPESMAEVTENIHADVADELDETQQKEEGPVEEGVDDNTFSPSVELKSPESHLKDKEENIESDTAINETEKCSQQSKNKGKRTKRPRRNLKAARVRLTSITLGKKTSINLRRCRIPAIRQVWLTEPKPTSTNVFHIPDHIPSALDLKAEAEAEVEAKKRELAAQKARESEKERITETDTKEKKREGKEIKNKGKAAQKKTTEQEDTVVSKSKNTEKKSSDKPLEIIEERKDHQTKRLEVEKVERGGKNAPKGKSNFFLVKTSVGNYLVPIGEGEHSTTDSAKKVQQSLEEYLVTASSAGFTPSRQSASPKKSNESIAIPKVAEQGMPSGAKKEKAKETNNLGKLASKESPSNLSKRSESKSPPKRSASGNTPDVTAAKVPKVSLPEKKDRPSATNDRIKALKEKLKRDQEKLEAIRKKNLIKSSSLSEFDDL